MTSVKTVLMAAAAALSFAALPAASMAAAAGPDPLFEQPPKGATNFTGKWAMAKPVKHLLTVDGKEPPLTDAGKAAYAKTKAAYAKNPKADPDSDCVPQGIPRLIYSPHPFLILQTTKEVAFLYEPNHTNRIIYWDAPRPDSPFPIWLGNSSAHLKGKTLSVDSQDFNDQTWLDYSGLPHGEKLKTQERYTLVSPTTIKGEVTIDDPDFYTKPWTASFTLTKQKGMDIPERVCMADHEM